MTKVILSESNVLEGDIVESLREMEERERKKGVLGAGDLRFGVSVQRRGPLTLRRVSEARGEELEMNEAV